VTEDTASSEMQAPEEVDTPDIDSDDSDVPEPKRSALAGEALERTVEALLFVADKPLPMKKLRRVLEHVRTADIEEAIASIRDRLISQHGPIELRELGGGYKFCTKAEYAPYIKKLYGVRGSAGKLSQAALETLAVIAYKQPVIRAEVEAIRGVAVDSAFHTLLDRKLIEQRGYRDVPGRPAEYGTSHDFLMYFGLNDLTELPTIEALRKTETAEAADAAGA